MGDSGKIAGDDAKPPGKNPCGAASLEAFSLSGSLNAKELEHLNEIVAFVPVAKGQSIIAEGEPADHRYIVNAGCIKTYKLLADGREQITGFLYPADFFGLAVGGCYAYSGEAIIESSVCRFPADRFEALLAAFPGLEKRLLAIVSNELAAAQDQMLLLGCKMAQERVASFLQMLARRAHLKGHDSGRIDLPMKRAEIADYLGLSTETVSRCFSGLHKQGAIDLENEGKTVIIPDAAILAELEGQ